MANILVFGDSIGQGYFDNVGGWVDRLKKYFLEQEITHKWKQSVNVFNLSLSGDTSNEILDRFGSETKPRVWENYETIVIFAVGINDSAVLSNGNYKTSIENFKKNLTDLSRLVKKYSNKIIFIGLTPIEEGKVTPMPWNPEQSYLEKSVIEYDSIIRHFCKENNLAYIYLYNKLSTKDLFDGAHPNAAGHELIFKIVKNFLEEKKYI